MGKKEGRESGLTRRRFIKTVGATGTALVGASFLPRNAMADKKVTRLRWQGNSIETPPTKTYKYTSSQGGASWWNDWVKEATDGRLIIDRAKPGAIVRGPGCFEAVSTGMIDGAGHVYAAMHGGVTPESNIIIGLPLAWPEPELVFDALYRRGMIEIIREVYAEHNIYPLIYPMGAIYHIASTKPINGPDDLKGKKIRAMGIFGDYVKAFGASPVSIPHSEVYMGLKMGTIDGAIFGIFGGLISKKTIEVCKYYVAEPNLNTVVQTNLINLRVWNSLPADIRTIIERDSKYVFQTAAMEYQIQRDQAINKAKKEMGLKITTWSDEDKARVRELAIEKLWPKVASKSPRCAKMVEMVKAQLKDLGRM